MSSRPGGPPAERPWLAEAFRLAERGRLGSSPNPMVGAVVLDAAGNVVGRGWHRRAGEAHAEVVALREAGGRARGGTIVVTLEPCAHTGRTGPCTAAIVEAGIRRVVAAASDPNPLVAGRGYAALEGVGLEVVRNADPGADAALNRRFRRWAQGDRPYVTLKMASSVDGRTATASGESKWITGPSARARVALLREEHDALAVGIGTVLADDPRLGRRLGWRREPPLVRVIFDRTLRLSPRARLFDDPSPVVVVARGPLDPERGMLLRRRGAEVLEVAGGADGIAEALKSLRERGVGGLLLEGGATLAASFVEGGFVDRWVGFVAPLLLGGGRAPGLLGGAGTGPLAGAPRLSNFETERVGDDWLLTGDLA